MPRKRSPRSDCSGVKKRDPEGPRLFSFSRPRREDPLGGTPQGSSLGREEGFLRGPPSRAHNRPEAPASGRRGGATECTKGIAALSLTAIPQPMRSATTKVPPCAFSFPDFFLAGKRNPAAGGKPLERSPRNCGGPFSPFPEKSHPAGKRKERLLTIFIILSPSDGSEKKSPYFVKKGPYTAVHPHILD